MALANSRYQYGSVARFLHWLTFLLLIGSFSIGLSMVDMPVSPQRLKYFSYHKWIGVTVFMAVILRLGWRLISPAPPLIAASPAWQQRAAHATHGVIYLLLIAIPLTGWLMSSALGFPTVYLGLVRLPDIVAKDKALGESLKLVHFFLNKALIVAVVIHVAAALKHHFVDRDATLRRMWPFAKVKG